MNRTIKAKKKPPKLPTASEILRRKFVDKDPQRILDIEQHKINARIAQLIYSMRTDAGLSQGELAKKVGTQQPAISRLEDAEYDGHSLNILQRIADTLGYQLVFFASPLNQVKRIKAIAKKLKSSEKETKHLIVV